MKDQVSESVKLVYPLRLVLKVAGITSAAWYRKPKHRKEKDRRGPRVVITDQALLDEVRKEITQGHFIDEGYKKTWKRLKRRGIKVCKARVYRVMRENNLLSVTRPKPERKVNEHKGNIKTDLPNRMWGTDGKSYVLRVSLFHPGLKTKILGFLNYAKNENLVIIARDNDDQLYLLGDEVRPAIFTGSPDGAGTGKETAGRRGVSMEFSFKSANVYVYTGSVPLTPAL